MKTSEARSVRNPEQQPIRTQPSKNKRIKVLAAGLVAATMAVFAQPPNSPILPSGPDGIFMTRMPRLSSGSGGGGSSPANKPAPNPPPPTNVVATFSGTAYTLGAARTPTTSAPQAEEHIAVDPNNPNSLVAAISDFSSTRLVNGTAGHNTTKYALSWDNGNSWSEAFVPLDVNGFPITSDGHSWDANSDPVVAIDKSGNVYMADLYFNGIDNANGVYVNVGDLSGAPFTAGQPVAFNYDPNTSNFEDKPWIAVDNSGSAFSGKVYVSWTRFTSTGNDIYFSTSANQGAQWAPPLVISPATQTGHLQGSQVAVGPEGTVYVVWYGGTLNKSTGFYQYQHFLAKSTDGGQTFSTAAAISPIINNPTFTSTYRKNPFPALAVDPRPGYANLYVVWADQPDSTVGSEVKFIASINGSPFTSPVIINDRSAGQQFMPALTVDSQGTVHCSWFDTRNSPTGTADYYDIYATYTANGGATFAPNARVTSATIAARSFIGDYAGIAAGAGSAHPVWTSGQLQTGTLLLPGAQDFSLAAAPGSASVAPGQSATFSVYVTGYDGFSGAVDLSVGGLPADAIWAFDPPSISGTGASTLLVSSATLGAYDLTVTGTSGAMIRGDTITLTVENPDFSMSITPGSALVPSRGGTATYTVAIARLGGFSDTVDLSVDGLPIGASATFDPNPAIGSSTLNVTVAPGTLAASYTLTITGAASGDIALSHTATATLLVAAVPTAVYVVQPSGTSGYTVSGGRNNTANLTVQVVLRNDFGDPVAGASVANTLYLNGATYGSAAATTASDGTANFIARNAPAGTYTTKVTSVTATGLTWDGKTPANSYIKK